MRVERLQSEFDLEVVYRHFPLHAETPDEGSTLEQLFEGRNIDIASAQERMKKLMADEGLPYGERSMTYNSRLAQELAAWATTQANGQLIHNALFQAYFVENINLANTENLLRITDQIELPKDQAEQALKERRFRDEVDADWQRSRELGITGVPTFIAAGKGLVGAQPYEQLASLVAAAQQ